jgi:hypothetical protein
MKDVPDVLIRTSLKRTNLSVRVGQKRIFTLCGYR